MAFFQFQDFAFHIQTRQTSYLQQCCLITRNTLVTFEQNNVSDKNIIQWSFTVFSMRSVSTSFNNIIYEKTFMGNKQLHNYTYYILFFTQGYLIFYIKCSNSITFSKLLKIYTFLYLLLILLGYVIVVIFVHGLRKIELFTRVPFTKK